MHAEQTWLSAGSPDAAAVRWSVCGACRRITIWEHDRVVHPPASAAHGAHGDDPGVPPAVRSSWDELAAQLEALEAPPARDRLEPDR